MLLLDPSNEVNDAAPYASYFADKSHSLTLARITALSDQGAFRPVGDTIDFGSVDATIWLRLLLKNNTNSEAKWVLNSGSQRMRLAELYLRRDASTERQILDAQDRSMDQRPKRHRLLITEITLAPEETVEIFYRYRSHKSSYFPLKIFAPAFFSLTDFQHDTLVFFIFSTIAIFAIYAGIVLYAFNARTVFFYFLFVISLSLYLLQQLGYLYVYIWPDFPYFNSRAALFLGYCSSLFGLLYGWSFFHDNQSPRIFFFAYSAGVAFNALGATASLVFSGPGMMQVATAGFIAASLATLLNIASALWRLAKGDVASGVAAMGWSVILLYSIFVTLLSVDAIRVPGWVLFDSQHIYAAIAALIETSFLTLALTLRARSLTFKNQNQREEYVRLLEHESESNKAVAHALRDREVALIDAQEKLRALRAMAHDIRQPLHAVRLIYQSKDQAGVDLPAEVVSEAFEMIEHVLTTSETLAEPQTLFPSVDSDEISLQEIFEKMESVFRNAARAKGIKLRAVPTTAVIRADRSMLSRVLSNLLTNSINATTQGGVLIGCKSVGGKVAIRIVDTGHGIAAKDAAIAEGGKPAGRGLGLGIARLLCARLDFKLELRARKGGGTEAQISTSTVFDKTVLSQDVALTCAGPSNSVSP